VNNPATTVGGTGGFDLADFQKNRGWFLVLGIILIIVGSLAIIYDVTATLISVFAFGWLLMFMGAFEALTSLWQPKWSGLFLQLTVGILAAVVGFHFLTSPAAGALILTFLVAVYFMVIGILQIVTALTMRFPGWGWVAFSGLVTFILGVFIKQQWPVSGLWVIGLFIGIDMVFRGWSYVMLFLAARK
jgi:uncharacterized membrane protein HdeD (DUF308 family)